MHTVVDEPWLCIHGVSQSENWTLVEWNADGRYILAVRLGRRLKLYCSCVVWAIEAFYRLFVYGLWLWMPKAYSTEYVRGYVRQSVCVRKSDWLYISGIRGRILTYTYDKYFLSPGPYDTDDKDQGRIQHNWFSVEDQLVTSLVCFVLFCLFLLW